MPELAAVPDYALPEHNDGRDQALFKNLTDKACALGGQYGGAITYVAERVSDERRGYALGEQILDIKEAAA